MSSKDVKKNKENIIGLLTYMSYLFEYYNEEVDFFSNNMSRWEKGYISSKDFYTMCRERFNF